jgi:hypothetical protein
VATPSLSYTEMSLEFYEVWAVDQGQHELLIDTTPSIKEAKEIALSTLEEDLYTEVIIYKEDSVGNMAEYQRFKGL